MKGYGTYWYEEIGQEIKNKKKQVDPEKWKDYYYAINLLTIKGEKYENKNSN